MFSPQGSPRWRHLTRPERALDGAGYPCVMLRNSLLTLHIIGVVVWLGCGLFDVFLAREVRRARGSPLELTLFRVQHRYGWVVAAATILVAITGVLMSSLVGWGYFTAWWLGLKQAIMLAVVAGMTAMLPMVIATGRELRRLPEGGSMSDELRGLAQRSDAYYALMRLGALAALLLGVWRPG